MIGLSDVAHLEEDTRALREMDYRRGGEACLDGVRQRIRDSLPLLTTPAPEHVRQRLHVASADLRNLAGWVCFDVGQLSASRSGDDLEASILSVNAAWACAKKGAEHGARTLLDRGQEQFTAANRTGVAGWATFFTEPDLSGLAGAVHTDLAGTTGRQYAQTAVALLTTAVNGYDEDMVRSRTLSLILLSTSHLIAGEVQVGVDTGLRALAMSRTIGSARVRDLLRPLASHARKHREHAGARQLAERIGAGTAAPAPPGP